MTKFYMIKNQKILDAVAIYKKNYKERNKFIADFYSSHGIDGHQYYLAGNGPINKPFTDTWEKHIALHIENTTNNLFKICNWNLSVADNLMICMNSRKLQKL